MDVYGGLRGAFWSRCHDESVLLDGLGFHGSVARRKGMGSAGRTWVWYVGKGPRVPGVIVAVLYLFSML